MKMLDLGPEERPREKIVARGAASLTNAELLAVVLRTGSGAMNAVDLARSLLASGGNKLTGVSALSLDEMQSIKGIGRDKATAITATFELARRFSAEGFPTERTAITTAEMVFKLMRPLLKGLDHEECWVLFLNRANYLLSKERMSVGGATATVIDCKQIVRRALDKKATGVILVHNHPSGDSHPGTQDKVQTLAVKQALSALDIQLLDHVVVADDSYYSFDSGLNTIFNKS